MHTIDLGEINSHEVIARYTDLKNKNVVDIGCGNLTFTIPLADAGANVLAIDPDTVQAELNRQMDLPKGLTFQETGATDIPVDDNTLDGIFFSYSLHHVPAALYPQVEAELFRILKPSGFLCVIEPTDCPFNQIMKLFHDEDRERQEAQDWIEKVSSKFRNAERINYHSFVEYDCFDQFATRFASRSFNSLYSEDDVRAPQVKTAFEAHAPNYRFQSPKTMVFLNQVCD